MIGKLKGTIDEIGEDHCILDVHGVGYVVFCPAASMPARRRCSMSTPMSVRT
jgi:Holliday junction DNA helicase RuvA